MPAKKASGGSKTARKTYVVPGDSETEAAPQQPAKLNLYDSGALKGTLDDCAKEVRFAWICPCTVAFRAVLPSAHGGGPGGHSYSRPANVWACTAQASTGPVTRVLVASMPGPDTPSNLALLHS